MSGTTRWALLATVLVLAGCGGKPVTGKVDAAVKDVAAGAIDALIDVSAEAPADGPLLPCTGTPPRIAGVCVVDSQGMRTTQQTGIEVVPVTVVSVGSGVPPPGCAIGGPTGLDLPASNTRIVFRSSDGMREWTAYVLGLPPGIVTAGASLELTLSAAVDATYGWIMQSLTLNRAGHLVMFASAMNANPGGPLLPMVATQDFVAFQPVGLTCMDSPDASCWRRRHLVQVVWGMKWVYTPPGQTIQIDDLTVALAALENVADFGGCTEPTTTIATGYVTPK